METGRYGISFFDDLDHYLPALLYDSGQFRTVQDLVGYIQRQAAYHLNRYERGREAYSRGRGRRRGGGGGGGGHMATPAWTRTAPAVSPQEPVQQNTDILNLFASILNPTRGTTNSPFQILSTELYDLTPVAVRPTRQQLDRGSQLESPDTPFTIPEGESCAICQDPLRLPDSSPLRRLRHCSHTFHRTCIDTWYTSHVHCPICRHDIRE